jgi:hypothetical protein
VRAIDRLYPGRAVTITDDVIDPRLAGRSGRVVAVDRTIDDTYPAGRVEVDVVINESECMHLYFRPRIGAVTLSPEYVRRDRRASRRRAQP